MLAASFIDIDEKIIPDEITVTGTMLGLLIAAIVPMSLLPHVSEPLAVPAVGEPLVARERRFCDWSAGIAQWLEPVTAVAPRAGRRRGACFARPTVARDRAWLLLAVVLCTRAANLARQARARVCVGFDLQPIVARVSSRAVVVAWLVGHDCDYVRLVLK